MQPAKKINTVQINPAVAPMPIVASTGKMIAAGLAGEYRPPDCSEISNNAIPKVHINMFRAKLRRPVNLSIIMADTVPSAVRAENRPNKVLPLAEKSKRTWLRMVVMTINKKVLSRVLTTK